MPSEVSELLIEGRQMNDSHDTIAVLVRRIEVGAPACTLWQDFQGNIFTKVFLLVNAVSALHAFHSFKYRAKTRRQQERPRQ
ncbi:hypothetical protein PUN28_020830 [Cardiocondyla obscurior]|uniref:Uncharacterized protein n=1 Tax=Cardiocondyla obscurior TaxID=286306 RepID=A0AAW2EB79_9HYME